MKSKIYIWDCRRAIEIAGGLPLAIRGDLFAEPGPHPVARWISETALVTQLEVKQGRAGAPKAHNAFLSYIALGALRSVREAARQHHLNATSTGEISGVVRTTISSPTSPLALAGR